MPINATLSPSLNGRRISVILESPFSGVADQAGLEPATIALTVRRSTS